MTTVNDNFSIMRAKMGNFGAKCIVTAVLLLAAALMPWPSHAGTAGKVYNLSLDIGTLDNHPLYYITTFPTTFKFRARVIDQLGSPVTGLTSSQLVVHSGRNAITGAAWTAGTEYSVASATFAEISAGLYEWQATINAGALATNDVGQFEVRVTGASATDNQWLANTIFVKNGSSAANDVKYVVVQPRIGTNGYCCYGDPGAIFTWAGDFPFWVKFYGPQSSVYLGEVKNTTTPSGELVLGLASWLPSSGSGPLSCTVDGYHDYGGSATYYLFLTGNFGLLGNGAREYITISVKKGNYEFLIPMGLTAVSGYPNNPAPLGVPTYNAPYLFPLTTIQNYRPGPAVTIPPGAAATRGNIIIPSINTGTDTWNSVTLNLGAGGGAAISRIDITDSAGTTVYGSLLNPASDTPVVPYSPAITVNGSSFHYIKITPKSHADMPPPPGASLPVPAGVTAVDNTTGNPVNISDWGTSELTIDNLSPANPSWAEIIPGNRQVDLAWTNPGDADYSQAIVLRSTAAVADTPAEGASYSAGNTIGASTVVCVVAKPGTNCTDTGLTNGSSYYYRIFARDTNGNYSAEGSGSGPHVPSYQTTPGTCSATAASPTTINVAMPYSNDANGNNTYTVDYRLSCIVPYDPFMVEDPPPCNTPWANWVTSALHAVSPANRTITGLSQGATYDVRCTFLDADGVQAPNPQEISGIVMFDNRTNAGTATAIPAGPTAIAVSMPYTDDYNASNTYTVDYQLVGDTGWANWRTATTHTNSPYTTTISDLQQGGTYNVRLTYVDSDGIKGANPQTITDVTLPDNRTEAWAASAVAINSAAIQVSASFAKDANGNGTIMVEYKYPYESEWRLAASDVPHPASPVVVNIGGLSPQTSYDVKVTYVDPDGVIGGGAEQILFGIATPANKLMHNSLNANKKGYWAGFGGWGVPGGQYGEFTCMTCHELRAQNASGVKTFITLTPLFGSDNFGGMVRFDGPTGSFSLGDDSAMKPDVYGNFRICQVCHTQTYGRVGWKDGMPVDGPVHRKSMSEPSNHAGSNGQDCTRCHYHDNGFASPW